MALWIKVCGVTNVEDALVAVEAGADAVGVNFVDRSKRLVDAATARAVERAVGSRVEVVSVVANRSPSELAELRERTGIEWLQLVGNETADTVSALLPRAFKAVRIGNASDVEEARSVPGERLLCDAKVAGELGGTGKSFDWKLVTRLSAERAIIVAGGLGPENVAGAVRITQPFGVDVASGVEADDPRRKDPERVIRFVRAARLAESAKGNG